MLLGKQFDRGGREFFAPACRPVWLGIDGYHLVAGLFENAALMDGGKLRRAGKDTAKPVRRDCHVIVRLRLLCLATMEFFELLTNPVPLDAGEIIHEQFAVQVIQFVLNADGH